MVNSKGAVMKKNYVVNGAAHHGFGEACARLLIEEGYKVFGLYCQDDKENAAKLSKEFGADVLELVLVDLNNLSDLKEKAEKIPAPLNGFVNAWFSFDTENVDDFNYSLAEELFRANYHVPMLLSVELKKKMVKGSSIVIVTSTESERGSYGGISYAASKAAASNMIKSLACNWGEVDQIRVNAVAAGWIGGEMDTDGPFAVSMDITPLGRLGRPEEIADVVAFLLSDKSSFINAQTIIVDGGYLAVDEIAKFEYAESK